MSHLWDMTWSFKHLKFMITKSELYKIQHVSSLAHLHLIKSEVCGCYSRLLTGETIPCSVLICYSFSLSHRLLEGEKWVSDWDSQIISKGMILSKKLGCLARCHSCQKGTAAHQQLSGSHDQSIESWFLNESQWGSSYKEVASLDMSRVMTHGRSNVTVSAAVLHGDYVNFRLWFASVSDIMFNNFHLVISMHP